MQIGNDEPSNAALAAIEQPLAPAKKPIPPRASRQGSIEAEVRRNARDRAAREAGDPADPNAITWRPSALGDGELQARLRLAKATIEPPADPAGTWHIFIYKTAQEVRPVEVASAPSEEKARATAEKLLRSL